MAHAGTGTQLAICTCAQARKLEGELDVKLAAYAKLCSGFESSYRSKVESSSLGADQVRAFLASLPYSYCLPQ